MPPVSLFDPRNPVPTPALSRRSLLKDGAALFGLSSLFSATASAVAEDKVASFQFAFLTDIHVDANLKAPEGLRSCVSAVNSIGPDFVLTGGDLIMDALAVDAASVREQWALFDAEWKNLRCPSYHTIGNHDVGGWAKASKIAESEPEYGKALFASRYGGGGTFRSFDHRGWHFIILDSVAFDSTTGGYEGWIDDAQIAWLREDLEKTGKTTPVIVSTHIPFFSVWGQFNADPRKGESRGGLVGNAFTVQKILNKFNVKLVLCGHGHISERIELSHHNKTTFIQGGAVSGMWWKGPVHGNPEGFGVVRCRENGSFDYQYRGFQRG